MEELSGWLKDFGAYDAELDRVAFTSRWVAAERGLESDRPDALFVDPFAKNLGGTSGMAFSEKIATMYEEMFGWRDWHRCWMAIRTKVLDEAITDFASSADGSRFQMVNLGAGLDTRAFRLECLADCSVCFEVDMPEVLRVKDHAMSALKAHSKCPRVPLAADVTDENLEAKLFAVGFDVKVPTFWLLEGLVMYLDPEPVKVLLGKLFALSAPGSKIACGFLGDPNMKMPPGAPLPPFICPPADFEELLRGYGWNNVRTAIFGDPEMNFGRYPVDRPPDTTQCFCFASRSGADVSCSAKM
mmetsp:Transcript_3580/g.6991  ORF Transcript_3580/g.6991 Transcript_3580/m.6991 type:complete len:300 (+) Transcript_3580:28-927(+)